MVYTTLKDRGKRIEVKIVWKDIEMQAMKQEYEQDIQTIRDKINQRFNQIKSMIQYNPKLAWVKSEELAKKNVKSSS